MHCRLGLQVQMTTLISLNRHLLLYQSRLSETHLILIFESISIALLLYELMSPLRRLTAITHFIIRIISEPTKIILLLFSEPVNLHYIVLITINTVDVSSAECQL